MSHLIGHKEYKRIWLIASVQPSDVLSTCDIIPQVTSSWKIKYTEFELKSILEIGWFSWGMAQHLFAHSSPQKYFSVDPLYEDPISWWISLLQEEFLQKSCLYIKSRLIKRMFGASIQLSTQQASEIVNEHKIKLFQLLHEKSYFFSNREAVLSEFIEDKFNDCYPYYAQTGIYNIINSALSDLLAYYIKNNVDEDKIIRITTTHREEIADRLRSMFSFITTSDDGADYGAKYPFYRDNKNYISLAGLAQHIPLKDNTCDIVMINFLLYAMDGSYRPCLQEACRVVKDDGKVIIADYPKSEVFYPVPSDRYWVLRDDCYWFVANKNDLINIFKL